MQQLFTGLHAYLKRRKGLFLVLSLLLLAMAVFVARKIRLEENLNAIIPEDQRINRISAAFDKSELADQLVFILSLKDTTAPDPATLIRAAAMLVDTLEKHPSLVSEISFRVGGESYQEVYEFIYSHLPVFLEEEDYASLEERIRPEAMEDILEKDFKALMTPAGAATGKFILKDPLNITPLALEKLDRFRLDDNFTVYRSAVFTRDQQHLLFFMDPAYPGSNTRENLKLINLIEGSLTDLSEAYEQVNVAYYGGTAVAVANSVRVKKDIRLTLSIALGFFLIIFLVFFRKPRIILLMFVPVVMGAMLSVAVLTLLYGQVSAIALGIGVIFIGITVDYSLHLFTHLRSGADTGQTIGRIAMPVVMSSLTTASAFLCLTVVRSSAMNQIGIFAAVAVVISALTVLTLTPLLLGKATHFRNTASSGLNSRIERFVGIPFEKNRPLVIVVLLLSVVFAFTFGKLRFNGDISTLNYQTEQLDRSEAKLRSISSVANSSVYLVTEGANMDEALETLERNRDLIRSCRDRGLISEISWVPDLVPSRAAQEEKIARWDAFWDRAGRDEVASALREAGSDFHFKEDAFSDFYELLHASFDPLPPGEFGILRELFLDNYISEADGRVSLVSILKAEQDRKDELFATISGSPDFIIFDNQFFINQFFDVLRDDFSKLVTISMVVVFAILLVFFGRIEIALITFIPILLSWMWTLGLMGLFGIEVNIFNIIISTFVFGLGIDYCIFLMNGIMNGYREGNQDLVPYKLSILLSAMTTIAGIGVLIFARHPALRSIAVVSIFGISTVVVVSYTLLPLLFRFLTRSSGRNRIQPVTLFKILSSLVTFLLFLGCAGLVTLFLPLFILLPLPRSTKKHWISRIIYLFSSFIVGIGFFIRKRYVDMDQVDFNRPSVIISNHQSQLDLVLLLQLHPRLIVLVNKWVWNNVFYGPIIRFADYYPVYKGLDHDFEKLKKKVAEGYSILAFPEGRRSPDGKIKRFHQGAFGIADKLGLEIQPLLIHGAYDCLPKTEHFLNPGTITLKAFPRFRPRATEYGDVQTFRVQAREVTAFYRKAHEKLSKEAETPEYFRGKLISRYIYKGPVLEWYLRVKIRLERDYRFFHELIPENAAVADLGCGYGFLSVMMAQAAGGRKVTGMDYDSRKIAVARQATGDLQNIRFTEGDVSTDELPRASVYVLNDVLHYLPAAGQEQLLRRCLEQLPLGGMLIARDADAGMKARTRVTRFTEIQSTRIFRFNRARHPLEYMPASSIRELARAYGYGYSAHDMSRLTSNITHVIRHEKHHPAEHSQPQSPGTETVNNKDGRIHEEDENQ